MWSDAEDLLDGFCKMAESGRNDALILALSDAYNRAIEERRRAEDLLKLRKVWESRRIGGVVEAESAVREWPSTSQPTGPGYPPRIPRPLTERRSMKNGEWKFWVVFAASAVGLVLGVVGLGFVD